MKKRYADENIDLDIPLLFFTVPFIHCNEMIIGEQGIKAEFMQPSFPTLTFPNHYTMCTGLYPSSHGIVANMFHDPALNEDFNYRIPEKSWDPKWWGGEPVSFFSHFSG